MEVPLTKVFLVFLVTLASATYDFVVKPEFGERAQELNITSFVGQTTRLPCTVKHLSGKRVSWIRQRDLQVLSTGRVTFSTDLRISVLPGTRFKLRKPRDLFPRDQLPPLLVSNGTNASLGNPPNEDHHPLLRSRPPLLLPRDTKTEEGEETQLNIHPPHTNEEPSATSMENVGNYGDHYGDRYHAFNFHQRKHLRRARRNVGGHNKHHRRQKKHFWHRDGHWPSPLLNFQTKHTAYTNKRTSVRFRKALTNQKVRALVSSPVKGQTWDNPKQTYAKENSPIAIYPQGPVSMGSDGKGLKLAPNYIDGVWEPEDYTLQIKYTKPQDAGIYICQINTEPRITQAVILRVVKMRAEIVGRRELFVKAGNPVKLSCRVNHGALSPGFILWYKGDRLVEYENTGGRIQILTEAGGVSHLLLHNAQPADSSNYTCSPAGGAPASLILNVIIDERQAAMQQGNHCPSATSPTCVLWPSLVLSQMLPYPPDHLHPVTRFLVPGILLGIDSYIPWAFKITVFVLLLSLFSSSNGAAPGGHNWRRSWRAKAKPIAFRGRVITTSSVNMGATGVRSFRGWFLDLTRGFLLPLRPFGKHCVVAIGLIVGVCVSVSLGCHHSYISDVV